MISQFVDDVIQDSTGGEILPAKREWLVGEIAKTQDKKKNSPAKRGGGGPEEYIAQFQTTFKKVKMEDGTAALPVDIDSAYEYYKTMKLDEVKDVLRWNGQHRSGTKPVLLVKCLDGQMYGRLARCSVCAGGRLKLCDDGLTVKCMGTFDEDTQTRVECAYAAKASEAPRWQPWCVYRFNCFGSCSLYR